MMAILSDIIIFLRAMKAGFLPFLTNLILFSLYAISTLWDVLQGLFPPCYLKA